MNYTAICPTKGRSEVTKRVIRCFLDQDYEGFATLLIYNNSSVSQKLGEFEIPENRNILLVNNHLSLESGKPYEDLGTIYNDIINFVPVNTDIMSHFECDDIYLQSYITEGVNGILRNNCGAWKSKKSYCRTEGGKISLVENMLEPSMFFRWELVKKTGYEPITGAQFHKLISSINDFVVEDVSNPQFVYCWDGEFNVFKTSGNICPENFKNYEKHSQDHGNGILEPWSKERIQSYYDDVSNSTNK